MQPNYPQYQPAPQNSTLAIISLIAAICGFTIFPFFGSLVAVVTGHMAKGEIARSGGTLGGAGAATWGLVLGYIGLGLGVIFACIFAILFALPFILVATSGQSSLLPIVAGLV
ncbi:MAG: DUF4190 domain-containing protein [Anaerolineales bacterium]|nr:DUF4190 domain-containing protein [Anaerolineales bacterium]